MLPHSIDIQEERVFLIDQTVIPAELNRIEIMSLEEMHRAIQTMIIRGAPAIGVAAAAGIALFIKSMPHQNAVDHSAITRAGNHLRTARPTAVNLAWAVQKTIEFCSDYSTTSVLKNDIWKFVHELAEEDIRINHAIGCNGANLFKKKVRLLTHCNAGSLATVHWGTALGVIRELHQREQIERVFADETRPRLQGGKLTAWELLQDNIPCTVITDNMAAYVMKTIGIDAVIVGADRIAANGDTANKIGTYNLAIVAHYHQVPFYIAAPISTIDITTDSGTNIIIEEREPSELTHINGHSVYPQGIHVINPSFDVTPAALIAGIITEKGVLNGNFRNTIHELLT